MFTGIVEAIGRIEAIESVEAGARLRVHAGPLAETLHVASSIAVNGCCLTVVELKGEIFSADLSGETLRCTSFGELKVGARVNLERPLRAGQELGGHFVQGHVDGVGRVTRLAPEGANWWFGVTRAAGTGALRRDERFDRDRRYQPHRSRLARRRRRDRDHSLHIRADEYPRPGRWRSRKSRMRHSGEVRRANDAVRGCAGGPTTLTIAGLKEEGF